MTRRTMSDEEVRLQLTRVYVALTLSRNVANQLVDQDESDKTARSLKALLGVTTQLLEQLLDPSPTQTQTRDDLLEIQQLM